MYEFWYDCVKPISDENVKFSYTDIDKLIVCIKIDNVYKDIVNDVLTRLCTSKFEIYLAYSIT